MANASLLRTWAAQLRGAVLASGGRENIAEWICNNTTDPAEPLKPWSFKRHEWQLGLVNCEKNHASVRKAAQIGASEITARLLLALAVVGGKAINAIMVLPSAGFSRKFVASRVDPIFSGSPLLKGLLNREINNLELKQVGGSFVHFAGAQQDQQAISVPASLLLVDEMDFCDFSVLSVFNSRLGHCLPGEDNIIRLSTPTLPMYGISRLFEEGDQRHYLVKHDACSQWVEANPAEYIVVPGYSGTLLTLTKRDLEQNSSIKVKEAWLKCPSCGDPITVENLADPSKRAWVAKFPDREEASFSVSPLDCPTINPPAKVAGKVKTYSRQADFINYGLGMPKEDSTAMALPEALDRARTERGIHPNVGGVTGTVAGIDVGVISHLSIGKKVNGVLKLIWHEKIRQDGGSNLQSTLLERFNQYGVVRAVIDSQPDISVPRQLAQECWNGRVLASYFLTGAGPKTLDLCSIDENEGVIKVARTRAIDDLVKELNEGGIRLLNEHPNADEVVSHLLKLRRVEEEGIEGMKRARWVTTDDNDHWAFSMLYLHVAAYSMSELGGIVPQEFNASKIISKVKLRLI